MAQRKPLFTPTSLKWLASGVLNLVRAYWIGVITFFVTIVAFTQFLGIGISLDKSLPDDHFYFIQKWNKAPYRGEKIAIAMVKSPMGPPEGVTMVKIVYGMPGDYVSLGGKDGREIFVNGDRVAYAKPFSKTGKPLTPIAPTRIPEGMMFLATPSRDSYDSRYSTVGLVPFDRIQGRVVTVF